MTQIIQITQNPKTPKPQNPVRAICNCLTGMNNLKRKNGINDWIVSRHTQTQHTSTASTSYPPSDSHSVQSQRALIYLVRPLWPSQRLALTESFPSSSWLSSWRWSDCPLCQLTWNHDTWLDLTNEWLEQLVLRQFGSDGWYVRCNEY